MAEPIVSLVVAAARNGVIGREGEMPWRLASDLKRFKRLTLGLPIVMGRRTFDSIGRVLPGRHTVVVTRDPGWSSPGAERAETPEDALAQARIWAAAKGVGEVAVLGGGQLYRALRDEAHLIRLTTVEAEPEGDTFFDLPEDRLWQQVSQLSRRAGQNDSHDTRYAVFTRRQALPQHK